MSSARIVHSVTDLPPREYDLSALPSELLAGALAPLLNLAEQLVQDDARILAGCRIDDRSIRAEMIRRRLHVAMLRRDSASSSGLARELRGLQDLPERQRTEGVLEEIVVASHAMGDPPAAAGGLARDWLRSVVPEDVSRWLKQTCNALAYSSKNVVSGMVRAGLDPVAAANGHRLDASGVARLLAARVQIDCIEPVVDGLSAAFREALAARQSHESDFWLERQVMLTPDLPGQPVAVGVWDTGIDLTLFTPTSDRGLAYDRAGHPVGDGLLRPLHDAVERMPALFDLLRGLLDVQANVDSAHATAHRQRIAMVAPGEVERFMEDIGLAFNYSHGTIVTQVAVDGNPFARVFAVAMHWPVRAEDACVDPDAAARLAEQHVNAVRQMQAAGVRVVNMSWGVDPETFETILLRQGHPRDAAERRQLARKCLEVERRALESAMLAAPEILFVAAAGNSANDAGFAEILPSSLSLPNLITVGAVDRGGNEALFTSVGHTVALHANGVEVSSVLPGGIPLRVSGTSVAAPQVTNVAAKLLALRPELTGAALRTLLIESGEIAGRLRLLHPRRAFMHAGIALP